MTTPSEETARIPVDRLQPGIFISLAERWLDHPFLFNEFRISSQKQIDTLREMGVESVVCYPARSKAKPLPAPAEAPAPRPPSALPSAEELALAAERQQRIEHIRLSREKLARCEKAYGRTAGAIRNLMQQLHSAPGRATTNARKVVSDTVSELLADQSIVLSLIGQKRSDDNAYFHALNVMILSLMMGKSEGLDETTLLDLGMGALFHDLGKLRLPDVIVKKGNERNRAEEDFYRLHTVYGEEIGLETGVLSSASLDILRHHHEHIDGSGFPDGLTGERISHLARIVAIANRYDNLCNSAENQGMTPAEALAQMFGKEQNRWDPTLLARFIKHLGVFPPGSIVQLSNGAIGLVFAVNRADPLRPSVMLYDATLPRSEANIVDLVSAPEVTIESALRRSKVPAKVIEYLAPRQHVVYFYDSESDKRPG